MCRRCEPNQGSIRSNGWFLTTSHIVRDEAGKVIKLIKPHWKCPFCGGTFYCGTGARALMLDDRINEDVPSPFCIFPIPQNLYQNRRDHPNLTNEQFDALHKFEMRVEALIDWLRMISLMGQLNHINVEAIKEAISNTNFWVETS